MEATHSPGDDAVANPDISLFARMTVPGLHLEGDGTLGAVLIDLAKPDGMHALKIRLSTTYEPFCIYGTRHQLRQLTAELAQVVEIGDVGRY